MALLAAGHGLVFRKYKPKPTESAFTPFRYKERCTLPYEVIMQLLTKVLMQVERTVTKQVS